MRPIIAYGLAVLVVVVVTTEIVAQATLPVAPPGVEPIVTQERLFSIPFYLNPRQPLPSELSLYVSGNQGRQWTLYQKRTPDQQRFDFQAGDEGEYWFVVRTPFTSINPSEQSSPEKIVVVDQTDPQLEVKIEQGSSGQIKANWKALDSYLDTSTFRITYQNPGDETWHPVTVRLPVTTGDSTFEGDVAWLAEAEQGDVIVRVEVNDRAGNEALFQKTITLHSIAHSTITSDSRVSNRDPYAGQPKTVVTRSDNRQSLSGSGVGSELPPALTANVSDAGIGADDLGQSISPLPKDQPSQLPSTAMQQTNPSSDSGWGTTLPHSPQDSLEDFFGGESPFDKSPFATPLDQVVQQQGPIQAPLEDPVADQFDPNRPSAHEPSAHEPSAHEPSAHGNWPGPNGQPLVPQPPVSSPSSAGDLHAQVTRSRRFNLDYEITDAGDSGVARVELWVTQDGGRSWSAFMTDEDRQSPMLVELDAEGSFGFRLLIHNGVGASSRPPQPGDEPDLMVTVDATAPQGSLRDVTFGEGGQRGLLEVAWQISDANLDESSLRLSYADRPIGPWLPLGVPTIVGPSRGQWQIDFRLPPEIYLKLEMKDRAGNAGEIIHPHPVRTVPKPPAGRIQAVRPIEGR